ncbi:hypothetical protein AX15_002615 [Amanita polypyramis BW_CC]|nr:hypothetical protein AX15_002615 [Amanita polypyramis BW_CC]
MSLARHRTLLTRLGASRITRHTQNRRHTGTKPVETDSCGIPLKPTWSVYELLSSYPKPAISSTTLRHIHELSALIPPEDGTPEHEMLHQELGDLVKLVEAVKLVNTDGVQFIERHYKEDWDREGVDDGDMEQPLLRHASRTADGSYVVDADRKR